MGHREGATNAGPRTRFKTVLSQGMSLDRRAQANARISGVAAMRSQVEAVGTPGRTQSGAMSAREKESNPKAVVTVIHLDRMGVLSTFVRW